MAQRAQDTTYQGSGVDVSKTSFSFSAGQAGLDEMKRVFDVARLEFESKVDTLVGNIPPSTERIAMVSMAYTSLLEQSPSFRQAIADGNRARAYYQLRFGSNPSRILGTYNRRIAESDLFGLYNDPSRITDDGNVVDIFQFTDGTSITFADLIPYLWGILIHGTEGDDVLTGVSAMSQVFGYGGNDYLIGSIEDEYLDGGDGDDVLLGGGSSSSIGDWLGGGLGNDTYIAEVAGAYMYDEGGADTYIISRNALARSAAQGTQIYDEEGVDRLVFSDVLSTEVDVRQNSLGDLIISVGEEGLLGIWYWHSHLIEEIEFADGVVWTPDDVLTFTATGTEGNDVLYGDSRANTIYANGGDDEVNAYEGDDTIYGGDGNDTLHGYSGNDILIGGRGNDALYGFFDSDVYLFSRGDGADIIYDDWAGHNDYDVLRFVNIARADIDLAYGTGYDLQLKVKGSTDSVTVANLLDDYNNIERIEFADGGLIEAAQIGYYSINIQRGTTSNDRLQGSSSYDDYLYGEAGRDSLSGFGGDDSLDGGAGADTLEGGTGNDWYLFTSGWGADTIVENDATVGNVDNVAFGSGLGSLDFVLSKNRGDLVITRHGSTDSITVQDWDSGSAYQTEIFRTADGSTLLNTQVDQLIQAMATFSANNGGITWDQALDTRPQDVQAILATYWQAPTSA